MTPKRWIILGVAAWLTIITLAHLWLNLGWFHDGFGPGGHGEKQFRVGFLPVT